MATTSGALLEALGELGARRIALVTPYAVLVAQSLEEYLAEVDITATGRAYLGLTSHVWKVPYREVVEWPAEASGTPPTRSSSGFLRLLPAL